MRREKYDIDNAIHTPGSLITTSLRERSVIIFNVSLRIDNNMHSIVLHDNGPCRDTDRHCMKAKRLWYTVHITADGLTKFPFVCASLRMKRSSILRFEIFVLNLPTNTYSIPPKYHDHANLQFLIHRLLYCTQTCHYRIHRYLWNQHSPCINKSRSEAETPTSTTKKGKCNKEDYI